MMGWKVQEHTVYSIFLFIIVALGILLALQFPHNKQMQMLVIVITTFFYVGLGLVHHKENHDLTTKIVIEYALIGGLGMTIVLFFLLGSQ